MKRILYKLNSALSRPTRSLTLTAGLVALVWGIALLLGSLWPEIGASSGLFAAWGTAGVMTGSWQLAVALSAKIKVSAELLANYFGVGVWSFMGSVAWNTHQTPSPFFIVSAAIAGVLLAAACVSIIRIYWQTSIAGDGLFAATKQRAV